jgi:hypothetical protein
MPRYELRLKSYHGSDLQKLVAEPNKANRRTPRPNANRIAASKEAARVARLQPPPGYIEMGFNPASCVFPIQAQVTR